MITKNIHQTISLKANSKEVYHSLMNSRLHSQITDSKVVIGTKTGSSFRVWDGAVNGIILKLKPNKKIVLAWRTDEWPEDHYSVAIFNITAAGNSTKLSIDQYGVPADDYKNIGDNWKACYWVPMKKMFEK